ncbi:MAG: sulfatase [Bacteroidales bacterium]|nr:sulfatase [Bacteroidales bacterium]
MRNIVLECCCLLSIGSCSQENRPPNIIVILVDDLGIKDLGCYGQQYIETPNIDKLASQGMLWENAYSSCPVCSPTRVALLTGKNPAREHFTGHITAIEKHRHPEHSAIIPPNDLMHIPLEEILIPEALKPMGYTSGSFGKWHVGTKGYWPEDQGFDLNIAGWTHGSPPAYFYPYENPGSSWNAGIPTLKGGHEGEYLPDRLTNEAMSFINENREKPFFVYLSYYAVHVPLQAPADLIEKYKGIVAGTKINPIYAAMVDRVDQNVGRILQKLDELDLAANTVVIFASDNGGLEDVTENSPYRSGKGHLYEGGIRVPFMMRYPGKIQPGTKSVNRTISSDVFYTIIDIAGNTDIDRSKLDGRSLVSDFNGETLEKQADFLWYYPHYGIGMDPGSIFISGDFKIIEHYDPYKVELFNIHEDIGEHNNLASEMPELASEMLNSLHKNLAAMNPIMHTSNAEYIENKAVEAK